VVLEVGKAGAAGYPRGELPLLRDGSPVAVLRASNWKEAATAVVGDREWTFVKRKGEILGRWSAEPEDAVRLRATQTSFWTSTWTVDLEGRPVEVRSASMWRSARRYSSGGQQIALSGTTGGWSPRPTLDADESLPLHQQVFLLWLEIVLSRRHNAAVSGGVGAAVIGGSS
jgi:hypothetical protein